MKDYEMAFLYDEMEAWDVYPELKPLSFVQRIWHLYGDKCVNLIIWLEEDDDLILS